MPKQDKIKIGISFSHKQNLGNFESAESSCWMEKEIDPKDELTAVDDMQAKCQLFVVSQLQKFRIGRQPKITGMSPAERKDKTGTIDDFGQNG